MPKQYRYVTQTELDARPDHMLRDGEILKVRMEFMDAMQRDIAQHFADKAHVADASWVDKAKRDTFHAARRLGLPAFTDGGDNMTRDAAAKRFGLSNSLALHRPGPRYLVDESQRGAVNEARAEYERFITNRWRDGDNDRDAKGPNGFGERGQGGAVEGMSCTVKGNAGGDHRFGQEGDRGTMRNVPGYGLICVSNRVKVDAAMTMDEIYAAYDESLRTSYLGGAR